MSRLEKSRAKFLADKNRALVEKQPRLRLLRRRLLAVGGEEVVLAREPHLEALLARPNVWKRAKARTIAGKTNDCHRNVARAWRKSPKRCRIVTGWVLDGDDVVWRQHSWILRGDELCETTGPRQIYYGVILDDAEAQRFARNELGAE